MIDHNVMEEIIREMYLTRVINAHGEGGADALLRCMKEIKALYSCVDPDTISSSLYVCYPLNGDGRDVMPSCEFVDSSWNRIAAEYERFSGEGDIYIYLSSDGGIGVANTPIMDQESLVGRYLVYKFQNRRESFLIPGSELNIHNPEKSLPSAFSTLGFFALEDALEEYKYRQALPVKCEILARAFHDGQSGPRLYLTNRPEYRMRDSLVSWLKAVLRSDAEVRPEQVVDESHPVDVKVTFSQAYRIALIEVKWVGISVDSSGKETTRYSDSRVREGARQLADYLDENYRHEPLTETKGYLAVYDARRKSVTPPKNECTKEEGLAYRKSDISIDPKYYMKRSDFTKPVRFFMEPRCKT